MQRSNLKHAYLFLTVVLFLSLHFPLVSAHNGLLGKTKPSAGYSGDSTIVPANESMLAKTIALYETLQLSQAGLSKQIFEYAVKGFSYLQQNGKYENDNIISIVDLSMPSTKKRLFVIDLSQAKVLFNTYVAHGRNSGKVVASDFSNTPESYKSSLGFYETLGTYMGGHGYSLKLEGLEKGINDNANRRAIVIHAADYVNESLIKSQGYIGRSFGCPALPEKLHKPIINTIKNGTCLFIYGQDNNYLSKSKIINA